MADSGGGATVEENKNQVYAIINNIPQFYHSSDLRNYFSQFVETRGFDCFHFRHRPEKKTNEHATDSSSTSNDVSLPENVPRTFCCVVKLKADRLHKLIKMYHRKHWLDGNGESISMLCYISKIRISQFENTGTVNLVNLTTVLRCFKKKISQTLSVR